LIYPNKRKAEKQLEKLATTVRVSLTILIREIEVTWE
jgi:hypothetical protein